MELAAPQHTTQAVPKKTSSFFTKKAEAPFFTPALIQPKLSVGPADDVYEREADAMADRVMRMPDQTSALPFFPAAQPISTIQKCAACDAEERLQRMEEEEEEAIQTKSDRQFDVQRKCAACEQEEMIQPKRLVQRKCAECEEEDKKIQPKREKRSTLDNSFLQRKCAACEEHDKLIARKETMGGASPQVTPSVHTVLDSPGHSLDKSTRSFMESRFGYDFGDVRIHNDVLANESSKDIHALAYTHGKHVVFAAGQYQPDTPQGKKLLAHELTHVVQQGGRKNTVQRNPVMAEFHKITKGPPALEKTSRDIEHKYRDLYRRTGNSHYSKIANAIYNCRERKICNKILTIHEIDKLFGIAKANGYESDFSSVVDDVDIPMPLWVEAVRLVVTEFIDFAEFQKKFLNAGFAIVDDPLAICIENCHHLNERPKFPVLPECEEPTADELKRGSEQVYELKGVTGFNPTGDLATYIIYNLKTKGNVTINVRFGNLSSGVITLTKKLRGGFNNDPFQSFNTGSNFNNLNKDRCVSIFDNEHKEATGVTVLPLIHPALNTNSSKRTMALRVRIDEEMITGKAGVLDESITDFTNTVRNDFLFHADMEHFVPVVFGEDHAGEEFEGLFFNQLESGLLTVLMAGKLNIINQQQIYSTFGISDEASYWKGVILTDIAGTESYSLPLERAPEAYMSGDSYSLQLNGEWTGKGYEATGKIHITYSKGRLSATGHGTIKEPGNNPRYDGDITISLSDYPTAEKLFFKHLPTATGGTAPAPQYQNLADSNLPDPGQKLALAAWGKFKFRVTEGKDTINGSTAFVVHPTGAIVTAGQIKLNTTYKIFNAIKKEDINVFDTGWLTFAEFSFTPVEVDISAKAGMWAWYKIGDIMFKELILSGVYSNYPGIYSEYAIAGVFDVDANVGASLQASIKIALNADFLITEWEIANARFDLTGTGNLDVHVRAKPSVKIADSGPGKMPTYTFGGHLGLNGILTLGLSAGVSANVTLFKVGKDEEDNKTLSKENNANLGHASWTIGNFGFTKDFTHTISGTQDLPDLVPPSKSLVKGIAAAIWNREKSTLKTKPGYEEGGKKKAEVSDTKFAPIERAGESIGKYSVEDSFRMNGSPHMLYMEVSGTKSNPTVEIFMHSDDKDKLSNKVDEEIKEENEASSIMVLNQKETEINKQELAELNDIKTEANKLVETTKAIATNGEAADRGVEHLADKIEDYGNKFEKSDLKYDPQGAPSHAPSILQDPSIVDSAKSEPLTDKPQKIPVLKKGDVVVDIQTKIGYIVHEINVKIEVQGQETHGFVAIIEGGRRFFPFYNYGYYWYKPKKTEVQPFTVSPKNPRGKRIAHVRVGQDNWEDGSKAGKINEKESAAIDYDPKGNKWNQAGHLVAYSLGGPGSYSSANIVPMTQEANHSYDVGMRKIENAVWQDINATYAIYDYTVEPVYDSTQRPPVEIIVKVEKQFPPDSELPSNILSVTTINNKA